MDEGEKYDVEKNDDAENDDEDTHTHTHKKRQGGKKTSNFCDENKTI